MGGGCSTATLDPLLQVLHGDFRIFFFDNNVCNRKRSTYLKGFFKTPSKLLIKSCSYKDFITIALVGLEVRKIGRQINISMKMMYSLLTTHWSYWPPMLLSSTNSFMERLIVSLWGEQKLDKNC